MSTNKIDKQIAEKLKDRTFEPSASAWERLNTQLNEHEVKPKRNWFLYVGYAAGIALLFSVAFSYFGKTHSEEPIEIITNVPIDTLKFDDSKLKSIIPQVEEAIVKSEIKKEENKIETSFDISNRVDKTLKKKKDLPRKSINTETIIASNTEKSTEIKKAILIKENTTKLNEVVIAKVDKTVEEINIPKKKSNSRITINSDDLLYAVTHTSDEVKAYYAKYNVNREDVLKTIKYELRKSNLKVNPNTILAEVERGIDDDLFQNNFMQKLKLKISDIAVAIVDRNK